MLTCSSCGKKTTTFFGVEGSMYCGSCVKKQFENFKYLSDLKKIKKVPERKTGTCQGCGKTLVMNCLVEIPSNPPQMLCNSCSIGYLKKGGY